MAKRKCSEVEMIGALKQMEAGRSAAEVGRDFCLWWRLSSNSSVLRERRRNIPNPRIWRPVVGGMSPSEVVLNNKLTRGQFASDLALEELRILHSRMPHAQSSR